MGVKNIVIILIIIGAVIGGSWILTDGFKNISFEKPPQETAPPEEQEPTEKEPSLEKDKILGDLFDKVESWSGVKYDIVALAPGQPQEITQTIWQEGQNMRIEMSTMGQKMVYLINAKEESAYMYLPSQNMATSMDYGKARSEAQADAKGQMGTLYEDYEVSLAGSEVVNGKDCWILEYTTQNGEATTWVWKDHGFPVKIESPTPQGTFVAEFRNIEFKDIPDSQFELPAGVQIMEMPQFEM